MKSLLIPFAFHRWRSGRPPLPEKGWSRTTAASLAAIVMAAVLLAGAPVKGAATSAVTTSVVSQYMFRGERRGGPSSQSWFEYRDEGLAIGAWGSFPLADKVRGQSDPEFDLFCSRRTKLADAAGITPGVTVYTYPNANTRTGHQRATVEPSLACDYTIKGLRLTPTAYYDLQLEQVSAELNAAYAAPLGALGTELDFDATLGVRRARDAIRGASPAEELRGTYALVGATVPYQITTHSKIALGVAWTKGLDFRLTQPSRPTVKDPLAAGRFVVTASYRYAF